MSSALRTGCAALLLAAAFFGAAPARADSLNADAFRAAPEAATRPGNHAGPAEATRFMVAAAHPLAARAARAMLRQGGTALDAAIAAQMVLNLVEPQSSGIGGGGFLLYWDSAEMRLHSYDGRESAPAGADETLFLDAEGRPVPWPEAAASPRSVGVPGLVAMLAMAHDAHGRLPWRAAFQPAIALAREGFGVSPRLHALLAGLGAERFTPTARGYFFDAEDAPWPLGHVLRNPELADTFEAIAEGGARAFYEGAVARDILAALRAAPGAASAMSEADLAGYRAKRRAAICVPYRGLSVCGMGPPSTGGIAVAQTLSLLSRFEPTAGPTPAALHLIMEAQKLAFADRDRFIADPDHEAMPQGLLDPAYLDARARLIDQTHAMARAEPGDPPAIGGRTPGRDATREAPGTTHISIIDADGNVASLTSSIETAFGSRIMVGGFLLNNQLTDFSFRPADAQGRAIANRPGPDKRPRSSMAPTILFDGDGQPFAALGSPGGSRIIPYVLKAVIAMTDWGMDPLEAAALANFGSRNGPAELEAGPAWDDHAEPLKALGHRITRPAMTSGLHIVTRRGGGLQGAADPRREGVALGD